jgi:hypothetical protein
MDLATLRMLEHIPDDLKARGWQFVRRQSAPYPRKSPKEYHAVYMRPFGFGVDNDRFVQSTQDGYLRVSTNQSQSQSWEQAYTHAIEMMRFYDSMRRDRQGNQLPER